MDPDVYRRLKALESRIKELEARDYATYNTLYSMAQPTDHFFKPTLDTAWSWQGAPFNGTPTVASLSSLQSHLVVGSGTASNVHYLARSWASGTPWVAARFLFGGAETPTPGLRIDDGGDNNYVEWRVDPTGTAANTFRLQTRTRTGGAAAVTTTQVDNLPHHPVTLVMVLTGGNAFYYYSLEPFAVRAGSDGVTNVRRVNSFAAAWAGSRAGICIRVPGSAANNNTNRLCIDWWNQST